MTMCENGENKTRVNARAIRRCGRNDRRATHPVVAVYLPSTDDHSGYNFYCPALGCNSTAATATPAEPGLSLTADDKVIPDNARDKEKSSVALKWKVHSVEQPQNDAISIEIDLTTPRMPFRRPHYRLIIYVDSVCETRTMLMSVRALSHNHRCRGTRDDNAVRARSRAPHHKLNNAIVSDIPSSLV
jgi:hypothetical protein